jgi:hypothetical protein
MGQPTVQQRFAFCTFCNDIDKDSVTRTFDVFADLTRHGFTTIHVLFQSNGGHTPEGIALHNYFKTFPIDLHLYNVGGVVSAALTAFAGAKYRYASARATFLFHKATGVVDAAKSLPRSPPESPLSLYLQLSRRSRGCSSRPPQQLRPLLIQKATREAYLGPSQGRYRIAISGQTGAADAVGPVKDLRCHKPSVIHGKLPGLAVGAKSRRIFLLLAGSNARSATHVR